MNIVPTYHPPLTTLLFPPTGTIPCTRSKFSKTSIGLILVLKRYDPVNINEPLANSKLIHIVSQYPTEILFTLLYIKDTYEGVFFSYDRHKQKHESTKISDTPSDQTSETSALTLANQTYGGNESE